MFKGSGMKYVVLTSKLHDGFALFDSQVSEYNIVDFTPFKRDIVKELSQACQRHGLKFGVYNSHAQDWDEPDAPYTKETGAEIRRAIHPDLPEDFNSTLLITLKFVQPQFTLTVSSRLTFFVPTPNDAKNLFNRSVPSRPYP